MKQLNACDGRRWLPMPIEDLTTAVRRLDQNTDRVIRSQQIRTFILVVFGLLILTAFVAGFYLADYRITKNTNDIRTQLVADCQAAKDIGELDIPSTTGVLGKKIVLDFRDTYNAKCVRLYGPLKPIDSDVIAPPSPTPTPTRSPR